MSLVSLWLSGPLGLWRVSGHLSAGLLNRWIKQRSVESYISQWMQCVRMCFCVCTYVPVQKKSLFYPGGQQGGKECKDISEVENMFFPHKEFTA